MIISHVLITIFNVLLYNRQFEIYLGKSDKNKKISLYLVILINMSQLTIIEVYKKLSLSLFQNLLFKITTCLEVTIGDYWSLNNLSVKRNP